MIARSSLATLRRRLLGLLLIVVLVAGVALSIAIYNKSFTTFVNVKLRAGEIGNQLTRRSDVKVRGLIVGEVRETSATPTGSELSLALNPESAELIPKNATARFLPKTLFGERYVALQIPPDPAEQSVSDGDLIPQDRTENAIMVQDALKSLMPVLQAVQPQKLSSTLSAISNSLQGRGESLGETLSELGQYVGELNPHLPDLQHNLQALATFSDNLNEAAPDLVNALDNLTTTSDTIVDQQDNLRKLFGNLITASVDLQSFLQANADNLIGLADTARPTAELLAKYAPEYPCVLGQMADNVSKVDKAFGKGTDKPGLHITLEVTANRGPYRPGQDEPRQEDKRGPRCYELKDFPQPFPQQPPDGPLKDGSTQPPVARSQNDGLSPPGTMARAGGYNGGGGGGSNPANTAAEQGFLSHLLGPQLEMAPTDVPGWSGLLVGPLYRGAEVTVE